MAKPLKHQVIAGALQLIVQQKNWTRGTIARSAGGVPCALLDPAAVRFCAVGALNRAAMQLTGKEAHSLARDAEIHVLKANGLADAWLPEINDIEGHARIIALFERALVAE
jgi:hypothetical protein